MNLVSIVIPIYNGGCYIDTIMRDLSEQTHQCIEVILVDNNSSDNTAEVCKHYVDQHEWVKYFFVEKPGASRARNEGIKQSRGEYIAFLDVDDSINPIYISGLVDAITNVDFALCGVRDVFLSSNSEVRRRVNKADLTGILKQDYFHIQLKSLLRGPVAKLYRRDIIKRYNILFPEEISTSEDQIFNFLYLSKVEWYGWAEDSEYSYIHRAGTLSHQLTLQTLKNNITRLELEKKFLLEKKISFADNILGLSGVMLMKQFLYVSDAKNDYGAIKGRIKLIFDTIRPITITDNKNRKFVIACLNRGVYFPVVFLLQVKRYLECRNKR